eukprot:TRINITY_DN5765_c0_g1_i4.p1 TRINITY_DN5765_c0_g1~~TRINITY_DN5765_c0_g1_i4.p1  ORF type:complete len:262 (+),score=55.85 TRINITY_DN5765_c0_g1_i4:174-959(+)
MSERDHTSTMSATAPIVPFTSIASLRRPSSTDSCTATPTLMSPSSSTPSTYPHYYTAQQASVPQYNISASSAAHLASHAPATTPPHLSPVPFESPSLAPLSSSPGLHSSAVSPSLNAQSLHKSIEFNLQAPSPGDLAHMSVFPPLPSTEKSSKSTAIKSKRRSRAPSPTHESDDTPACRICNKIKTSQWRRGPDGCKSLCNACGIRFANIVAKEKSLPSTSRLHRMSLGYIMADTVDAPNLFTASRVKDKRRDSTGAYSPR